MRSVAGFLSLFCVSGFFSPPLVRLLWTVWVDGLGLAVRDTVGMRVSRFRWSLIASMVLLTGAQ